MRTERVRERELVWAWGSSCASQWTTWGRHRRKMKTKRNRSKRRERERR
jgi:hypothetical protein